MTNLSEIYGSIYDLISTTISGGDINHTPSSDTVYDALLYKSDIEHSHVDATTSGNGFLSITDKTKLDGIEEGANNYSHPTGDGNLHIPANSTTSSGMVLTASEQAGVYTWEETSAGGVSIEEVHSMLITKSLIQSVATPKSWEKAIYVPANDLLNPDSSDFMVMWIGKLPVWIPDSGSDDLRILHKLKDVVGSTITFLGIKNGTGKLYFDGGGEWLESTAVLNISDDYFHALGMTFSIGATQTTIKFYVDGYILGDPIVFNNVGPLSADENFYIAGWDWATVVQQSAKVYFYNRAPSEEEMLSIYVFGPDPADIDSNKTELGNWNSLVQGKRYRIISYESGDDFTYVGATNVSGCEFVALEEWPNTWENNSVLRRIGCILQLEPEGIFMAGWTDSYKDLTAVYPPGVEFIRRTLFDDEVSSTQAFGDSATAGVVDYAAHRDHKHAMMEAPTSVSGNAGTATKLATARNIAGVSFDGTQDINIPFVNLSTKPTTLAGYGIADASTLSGSSTVDFKTKELTAYGHILPATNLTYDLGSPDLKWRSAYIDDLHLGTSTLYLGDTAILGTEQTTVNIHTSSGQSLSIKTTGAGQTQLLSESGTLMSTSGQNADVLIQTTGSGSLARVASATGLVLTAPEITINGSSATSGNAAVTGNLTVTGNIIQNGSTFTSHATTVTVEDNIMVLNAGEVGSGVTASKAGIQIDRGDLSDYQMVFDEFDDMFKVGMVGDLEAIASHDWVETGFAPIAHVGTGGTTHSGATTSVNGFMTSTDKIKLDGIEASANNYSHPASHSPTIITQDTSNRFVSDTEKATWNGKENAGVAASADSSHLSAFSHSDIDHTNRTALNAVSGTNTGDQTGGTPSLTLGTTNTAGSSTNFIRRDDTILAFDVTVPSTQAFGDSAAAGSASVAARRDHKHAMMAAPTSVSGNAGTVTGLSVTSGKTLTVQKTITLTSADDTSIITLPTGTKTLVATDGNISGSSGSCTGNAATSSSCSGNAATATTASSCSGNAATSSSCSGNAATATNATNHIAATTGAEHGAVSTNTANMIVRRDGNGDFWSRYANLAYVNTSDDVSTGTISYIMAKFGDNYFRSASAAKVAAFISGQSMNISGSSSSCSGNAATSSSCSGNAATSSSCSGNAATATKLASARTIGGVSFDGSANINLPGVNTAGNQNTSGSSASCTGNAATATTASACSGNAATSSSCSGNAATATSATNHYGGGGSYIASSSSGTSYGAAIQVREAALAGAAGGNMAYAPRLAFHWSGIVASSIAMDATGRITIYDNPGTSYEAFAAASIYSTGNVTAYSDERLKSNWKDLPIDFVLQLSKVKNGTYDRIDGKKISQVGVSAQSLRNVMPLAVVEESDEIGTLSIAYGNAAMASVVELAKEVVMLKKRIEILEERL